jgi:hypothetical protein
VLIEIEEGSATLTHVVGRGRGARITAVRRTSLPSTDAEDLGQALATLRQGLALEGAEVHVAFGDRRFLHFSLDLPALTPGELRAITGRECRSRGSIPPETRVHAVCRFLRRTTDGHRRYAVVGIAENALSSLLAGLRRAGLDPTSVTSLEDAIASAPTPPPQGAIACIDVGPGRARFVYCDGGGATQVRRILVPRFDPGSGDAATVAMHLAMEIPRTLDYLAGHGLPPPRTIVTTHELPLAAELPSMLPGAAMDVVQFVPPIRPDSDEAPPGFATFGLWHRSRSARAPSVHRGIELVLPRSWTRTIAASAAAAVVGTSIAIGVWLRQEIDAGVQMQQEFERQVAELRAVRSTTDDEDPTAIDADDERLGTLAGMRRPVSRMVAQVAASVPSELALASLTLARDDRIDLRGVATTTDRRAGLAAIAQLTGRLREVGYLAPDGEEIRENGETGALAFRILLGWRTP